MIWIFVTRHIPAQSSGGPKVGDRWGRLILTPPLVLCFTQTYWCKNRFRNKSRDTDPTKASGCKNGAWGKRRMCPLLKGRGFDEKRRKSQICVLLSKTRALLVRRRENDEKGGCRAGKGMVYQKHVFVAWQRKHKNKTAILSLKAFAWRENVKSGVIGSPSQKAYSEKNRARACKDSSAAWGAVKMSKNSTALLLLKPWQLLLLKSTQLKTMQQQHQQQPVATAAATTVLENRRKPRDENSLAYSCPSLFPAHGESVWAGNIFVQNAHHLRRSISQ